MSSTTATSPAAQFAAHARELIAAGAALRGLGMMPATSGNLSSRLADGRIAITVSGCHKGRLATTDVMLVTADGTALDARRPSAEVALHAQIYRRCRGAGAVLHTHALAGIVLSRDAQSPLEFDGYELAKAFPGVTSHATRILVPVFANDQDVDRLARTVDAWMATHAPVHGYLVEQHGLTAWGANVADAQDHVEAFDQLFRCEFARRTGRLP